MIIDLGNLNKDSFIQYVRVEDISSVHSDINLNGSIIEFMDGQKVKVSNTVDEINEMIKDYEK